LVSLYQEPEIQYETFPCRRSHEYSTETGNHKQLPSFIEKHNSPSRFSLWPSHCFLLFSQKHLKNHPKTSLKHIRQQSVTKCANVISQEAGLQECWNSGAALRAIKFLRDMEKYKNKQIVTNMFVSVQLQYRPQK